MNKISKLILIGLCNIFPINCFASSPDAWAAFGIEVERACMKAVEGRISDPQINVDVYDGTADIQGKSMSGGATVKYSCAFDKRTRQVKVTISSQPIPWNQQIVPGSRISGYTHGQFPSEGQKTHPGVDIGAACGTDVLSADSGKVVRIVKEGGKHFKTLGNAVVIQHADQLDGRPTYTLYLHLLKTPLVGLGSVQRWQKLGEVGETGFAKGCHVHFEVRHFEGIDGLFHPVWRQIYASGDMHEDAAFKGDWSDPEQWFIGLPTINSVVSSSANQASRSAMVPNYIIEGHRDALGVFLARNSRFRVAMTQDYPTWDEDRPYIWKAYDNRHPYYVVGDFNKDGVQDFAVILIDISQKASPDGFVSAIAIFNGPISKISAPVFMKEKIGMPMGSVLFYEAKSRLLTVGKFESGSTVIRPVLPKGYVLDYGPIEH